VILANHIADVDPIALQVCCPRLVHFMAKSELFAMPLIGPFLRWFHVFPVRRWEPDKGALRHAVALAKAGEAVCVFPEGQLSETGDLQPLLPGAALIVRMAGAPVICCGLLRMNRIIPYGSLIPRPALGWVTVAWGEARRFGPDATAEEILGWAEGQLRMLTGQEERA
jgi:1-acyl-sn-glycerol-3-phosphate acyltransferase